MLFDQVRNDFRVGLRRKFVTFSGKAALERDVVLDDSVVDDDNASLAVPMGVSVFLSGTTMGRPPRVSDAELAGERLLLEKILRFLSFPELRRTVSWSLSTTAIPAES